MSVVVSFPAVAGMVVHGDAVRMMEMVMIVAAEHWMCSSAVLVLSERITGQKNV